MRHAVAAAALLAAAPVAIEGHGQLNMPPGRQGGTYERAGRCNHRYGTCSWFSHLVTIPGNATLPRAARTYNVGVEGGPRDYSSRAPWRAPGSAPVYGSGCGAMGGGPHAMGIDGAIAGGGHAQGMDGARLPALSPTEWRRGEPAEVAWGCGSNHGGGARPNPTPYHPTSD